MSRERKMGFTDAESVLDMVFLDEGYAGQVSSEQIAAEKAWIRANGRRIVDLAHFGRVEAGPGVIWIVWLPGTKEQYQSDNFNYTTQQMHASGMDDPANQTTRGSLDPAMGAKWKEIVATHDASRTVVVVIISLNLETVRYNTHHYLVGMRGGGLLPQWGEEPPGRR